MIYAKIGGIGALVLALFFGGFYFGGLRSRAEMETTQAKQLQDLNTQLRTQETQLQASEAARQAVVDQYDRIKDLPTAATVGLAERVQERTAACPRVPTLPRPAGGTDGARPEPPSDTGLVEANQRVYDACSEDAKQLNALEAWVRAVR